MQGVVIKSTGSWYSVLLQNNDKVECQIRGKFRLNKIKSTNPVAVGDKVTIRIDPKTQKGVIIDILERKNLLIRRASKLSKRWHIIASNIDNLIIIASITKPRTSNKFIDRALVLAHAYHINPIIVFNKIDLYGNKDLDKLYELIELYKNLGYIALKTSVEEKTNLEKLKKMLFGKVNVVLGHSGVGKSSIINYINPKLNLRTQPLTKSTQKGKHTTSFYQMFKLFEKTFVIDTPGIKELGLPEFESYEIGHFFPEMKKYIAQCRFNTCLHIHEPECAVKKALKKGKIKKIRFESYMNLIIDKPRLRNSNF